MENAQLLGIFIKKDHKIYCQILHYYFTKKSTWNIWVQLNNYSYEFSYSMWASSAGKKTHCVL
jgi:hypothetical protein